MTRKLDIKPSPKGYATSILNIKKKSDTVFEVSEDFTEILRRQNVCSKKTKLFHLLSQNLRQKCDRIFRTFGTVLYIQLVCRYTTFYFFDEINVGQNKNSNSNHSSIDLLKQSPF